MSRRLAPFDALFLAMETSTAPFHMAGCEIFQLPKRHSADTVAKLVRDLRTVQPVFPFDVRLDTRGGWPRWQRTEVDLRHHVRHHRLPAPGTTAQLMELLEALFPPLLDRKLPLWECHVIEGLEQQRFAIAFKCHHALVDGQGGLSVLLAAMSHDARDRTLRALWGDNRGEAPRKPARRTARPSKELSALAKALATRSRKLLQGATDPRAVASALTDSLKSLASPATAQRLRDLWLFKAPRSRLSQPARSSARRYGIGDLPLERVKRVAKTHGATVNDVLLSVVDDAVHRYLREAGEPMKKALVTGLPVSVRKPGDTSGGNQAGALSVRLGAPDARPLERLHTIHTETTRAKQLAQQLPAPALMGYGALLLGLPGLLARVPGFASAYPLANLGVSNVSPPKGADYLGKPLYLRGARLLGLYAQPILPPSLLLNVTVGSINDTLCLGIASTAQAIDDPQRLAGYIEQAFVDLVAEVKRTPAAGARPASDRRAHGALPQEQRTVRGQSTRSHKKRKANARTIKRGT